MRAPFKYIIIFEKKTNRILTMYLSWDTLQGQKEPQRNIKLHSLVLLLVLMLGVLLLVV